MLPSRQREGKTCATVATIGKRWTFWVLRWTGPALRCTKGFLNACIKVIRKEASEGREGNTYIVGLDAGKGMLFDAGAAHAARYNKS